MGAFIERSVAEIARAGRAGRPGRLRAVRGRRFGGLPPRCWPGRWARGWSASSSTTGCSARGERAAVVEAFGGHSHAELRVVDAVGPVPRRPWRA